jgi:CheY-like chemotaxis protein
LPAVAESVKPKIVTQRVVGLAPGQKTFKLLIVDDRADNRLLLCRLFEPLGFALRQAVNGEEATHISQTWTPDLAWMDIRMPVMDGYDATKQIKALPNGAQIKIVALTASAFESQQAHINAAGCDGFLRKPFQVGEVFNILHKQLGVRFVYSDSESEVAVNANPARLELSKMSPAWRQAFKEAVESIDLDSARRLAMEVSQVDKSMAKLMRDLIENYRFDTLQSLLEKYDAD